MLSRVGSHSSAAVEAALRGGTFGVSVRELLGHYMTLEQCYLERTVAMAIRIDQKVRGQGRGCGEGI